MIENRHDTGLSGGAEDMAPTVNTGGVSTPWVVAIVKRNSEKVCRDSLLKEGLEAYVATQTIVRRYAKSRPKSVEYVRIPAKVFIRMHAIELPEDRTAFFSAHPYISSFMPDLSKGTRYWAEIPDYQMARMRQILGDPENEVTIGFPDESFTIGGKVKGIGPLLHGLEGFLASKGDDTYFCVEIPGIDWAKIRISKDYLEPVK